MGPFARRTAGASVALALVASACSDDSRPGGDDVGRLSGAVTVFAAASLGEALKAQRAALRREHPELRIAFSFAGSPQIVAQLREGARADVVATADQASMRRLVDAGLVEGPRVFARNRLEIVVTVGNPERIRGLADLGRPDLTVVLAAPHVPIGGYARQALDKAGVAVRPKSLETDVSSAVSKVALGQADATIAYVTDLRGAGDVSGVKIPDAENVVAPYPVAVLRASHDRNLARAYVDDLLRGRGRTSLRDHGFLPE